MRELNGLLSAVPGATALEAHRDGWWMDAPEIDVVALVRVLGRAGARLSTMTAMPLAGSETAVIYHFAVAGDGINIRTRTRDRSLPSIAQLLLSADWIEREIHDLYGVQFTGHPNLVRLIRPTQLREGFFRGPDAGD